MAEAIFMPRSGQSVESCIITEWVKKKGDPVQEGDILFCYETDKAAFEETAKVSGILLEVFYQEGDEVPVLASVAVIGKAGESTHGFQSHSRKTANEQLPADNPGNSLKGSLGTFHNSDEAEKETSRGKIKISPRARTIANAKGISLNYIKGSGPNGRIIVRDIESVHASSSKSVKQAVNLEKSADFRDIPLTNIRKLIGKGMHYSLQNSAQLTHHTSADARKLLELRAAFKLQAGKGGFPNISINDLVCFATIRALEKTPAINAHFLGDKTRSFTKVHLGIAVDTERGLMVPVVRNADELNLTTLSIKISELAESCRKGNIDPDLLQSDQASFTISNLGAYGIELFTPVINLPQAGILGVNTITYRPADLGNGIIGFIPVIGLSLTYDHRVLDGAPASAFLKEIRNQVENLGNNLV